jgi:hypothetical protein
MSCDKILAISAHVGRQGRYSQTESQGSWIPDLTKDDILILDFISSEPEFLKIFK